MIILVLCKTNLGQDLLSSICSLHIIKRSLDFSLFLIANCGHHWPPLLERRIEIKLEQIITDQTILTPLTPYYISQHQLCPLDHLPDKIIHTALPCPTLSFRRKNLTVLMRVLTCNPTCLMSIYYSDFLYLSLSVSISDRSQFARYLR